GEDCMSPHKSSSAKASTTDIPMPKFSVEGMLWNSQIVETRNHPRYAECFDFLKAKSEDGSSTAWMKAMPFGPWCATNPQVICIDCEMCETCNPETGEIDPKALCRISIVNGAKPDEVLLDTLVKPDWPVKDYRARINGISKAHLDDVKFTLRHAHEFMRSLCSEETVVIGHALHNDLMALKVEHHCNVDSSLLYPVADADDRDGHLVPSLKDLAKCVLGKEMPKIHDSVNDARTALLCAINYREKDGKVAPIVRTIKVKAGDKLFVHRLPKTVNEEHLSSMFLQHTTIMPKSVDQINFVSSTGRTHVSFASIAHANLAFESLPGTAERDNGGMLQKKVYLKNKDYIRVRKMVFSKGSSFKHKGQEK
ncbi:MAG: exonuclease domain-containing protein, partial [Gaiellaceae bacterium]